MHFSHSLTLSGSHPCTWCGESVGAKCEFMGEQIFVDRLSFLFLCVLLLFWNAFDSRRVRNTVANKIKFSYICFKLMSCMCFYVCCICISGFRMLSQFAIIEPSRHHVMVVAASNACVCVLCTRKKSFGSEIVARIVHKRHILCIDLSHWVYLIGINRTGFSSVLSLIMTISG